MKKLNKHIEQLLLEHDCVIIPGFGGFIVNYESARVLIDKDSFLPPARKIGFNIQLTYNDGLLAQALMKEEECSYENAIEIIRNETEELLQQLKTDRVRLGDLGYFFHDEYGHTIFEPLNTFVSDPQYYGLDVCTIAKVKMDQVPFSKLIWYSAAAAMLLFALLPINIFDRHVAEHASVFPLSWGEVNKEEMIRTVDHELIAQGDVEQVVDLSNNLAFMIVDSLKRIDSLQMALEQEKLLALEKEKKAAEAKKKKEKKLLVNKSDSSYYIIIASLPDEKSARQYLQEVKGYAFRDLCIVKGKKRYLVSVKEFTEKDNAETFVEQFRISKPKFSKAWIATPGNS